MRSRLRSSSGKVYTSQINSQVDSGAKMGTIEEVLAGVTEHDQGSQPRVDGADASQVSQLINMMKEMQNSINSVDQKVSSLVDFQSKAETRFNTLERKQKNDAKEVAHLRDLVSSYHTKMDILSDIVIRQQATIEDLKQQATDSQTRGMRNNILISGIPEIQNENCIRQFNKFVVEQLLIKDKMIPVEAAYRIGQGTSRTLLVILRHVADKALIFEHVGNLKGKKINGIQCFVASQLPEPLNEKRRKINLIMAENKKRPTSKKLPLSVKTGELLYKGEKIKQRIQTPSPASLLRLQDDQLEALNTIPMVQGSFEEQDESTFTAYATSVSNHQQVTDAYMRMKLTHGQATHIACAYRLEKGPEMQREDGCDDNEFGASRVLLNTLQEMQVVNVAVFMVRYYGGTKLGPKRFDYMRKVASGAVISWQVSLQSRGDPEKEEEWRKGMEEDQQKGWSDTNEEQEEEQA